MIFRKQSLLILFFSLISMISICSLNGAAGQVKDRYKIPPVPGSRSSQCSEEMRAGRNARGTNRKKNTHDYLIKACKSAHENMGKTVYSFRPLTGSIPPEFKPLLDWLIKNSMKPKTDKLHELLGPKVGDRAINIIWHYRDGRYLPPQFHEALRVDPNWQTIISRNPWILRTFFQHGLNPNANCALVALRTYADIAVDKGFGQDSLDAGADLEATSFAAGAMSTTLAQAIEHNKRPASAQVKDERARGRRPMPVPAKKS